MRIGARMRQLRVAKGWSLENLATHMGGIVTKQSLSKYEQGKSEPSQVVLNKIAWALDVKAATLSVAPAFHIQYYGFRKGSRLGKRQEEQISSKVSQLLEYRLRLQEVYGQIGKLAIPIQEFKVTSFDAAENAAEQLRNKWQLGRAPISDVTDTLEDRSVHILELTDIDQFDGLSATAAEEDGNLIAAAVITAAQTDGERQRFNITHELGHLVMEIPSKGDNRITEKLVNRFAGAFLAPRSLLESSVGIKRYHISLEELLLLKKKFGMSMQALLYRMRDLEIISPTLYKEWCIEINAHGWRRGEPEKLPREECKWFRRSLLRAVIEGRVTKGEAEQILGEELTTDEPQSLKYKRAFMKLSLDQRRQVLERQARELAEHYALEAEREDEADDDFIDYL